MKIGIDTGHGKDTAGKRTLPFDDGSVIQEYQFNRACGEFLAKAVTRCGMSYVLTAPTDFDTSLKDRVDTANNAKVDVFVSIHYNAYQSTWNSANGIETWYHRPTASGDKLAEYIQKELIEATGRTNRGIKPADNQFYVVKYTDAPANLIECGFMTNKTEASTMLDPVFQKTCAEAICKGVCTFLGVDYREEQDSGCDEELARLTAELKIANEKIAELQKLNEELTESKKKVEADNATLRGEISALTNSIENHKKHLTKYL